jgi:hypothetical protein
MIVEVLLPLQALPPLSGLKAECALARGIGTLTSKCNNFSADCPIFQILTNLNKE